MAAPWLVTTRDPKPSLAVIGQGVVASAVTPSLSFLIWELDAKLALPISRGCEVQHTRGLVKLCPSPGRWSRCATATPQSPKFLPVKWGGWEYPGITLGNDRTA